MWFGPEPRLTYNDDGKPRLYIRIGINHYQRLDSGGYKKLPPTYHDLVQFDRGAELSHDRFIKGDDFVAIGYVRTYDVTVDGHTRQDEQFVAYRLMHDPNTTTYDVHRRPRTAERDVAAAAPEAHAGPAPAQAASTPPPPPARSADGLGH